MSKSISSLILMGSAVLVTGCNFEEEIKDTSNAYYGDFSSDNVFVINLDKMKLEKNIKGGLGPYGLEPVGHKYLVSLTRKDTSIDIIDIDKKEKVITIELGYQPREVTTNPSKTYTVVSGRDIAAHTLINTQNGKVVKHFDRNKTKVNVTDFGGQNATGHPFFVNDNQYLILDRPSREIRLYHVAYGLQDILNTKTSMHHILRKGDDLFVAMEGSGTSSQFTSPGVMKIQIKYGKIIYDKTAYIENELVDSLGIHHINFHYDARHIYTGSNNGKVYVIDTNTMRVVDKFESGYGGGHTDFSPKHKRAVITNHKSNFITLVDVSNPRNNKVLKHTKVANFVKGPALQGHTQVIGDDENHFYGAATNDGKFFEVSMKTGNVTRTLNLGGELQQGFMFQSPEGGFAKPDTKFASSTYSLTNLSTLKVLAATGKTVKTNHWFANKNQGWDIRVRHDGFVNLVNRESKKCLQKSQDFDLLTMKKCNNKRKSQMWTLKPDFTNTKNHVVNRLNGKCLTASYYGQPQLENCSYRNHWLVKKAPY